VRLLEMDGRRCLLHAKIPANDGGLALGQAAIAAAREIGRSDQLDLRPHVSTRFRNELCVLESLVRS